MFWEKAHDSSCEIWLEKKLSFVIYVVPLFQPLTIPVLWAPWSIGPSRLAF